jgi:hypothetical protein
MFPPLSEQNCGNCRYSRPTETEPFLMTCRRNPPSANPDMRWPFVACDTWCGEWVAEEVSQ